MLSANILETITDCARDYDVAAVWLFGSSLSDETQARDIDLAVEGLPPELFFKFYGRLFLALPKPVDLVDLSEDPPIAPIIRSTGVRIYERRGEGLTFDSETDRDSDTDSDTEADSDSVGRGPGHSVI